MPNNYNNAAYFYDGLSHLVFGKALVKAQFYLLPCIPVNGKIVIIGGGTGRILEEITRLHPSGLSITYIEISARMIALSRKRNTGKNQIIFINKAVEEVTLEPDFDVIITPFLFDNFTDAGLFELFTHLHPALKSGGLWLNTDFRLTGKWWQPILLKSMLLFFKILCAVQAWQLPDAGKLFYQHAYTLKEEKSFYGDFVVTRLYRKTNK